MLNGIKSTLKYTSLFICMFYDSMSYYYNKYLLILIFTKCF